MLNPLHPLHPFTPVLALGVIDYEEFIPVMIAMMQQKKQAPNQQQRGNAASSKTSSALQAALSQSYERPAEMKRRYVRPSMPTARYTSEEALVEGRFPYVPRRRGVKPNPGAHSDALVMRSMESARSLNAAVGNADGAVVGAAVGYVVGMALHTVRPSSPLVHVPESQGSQSP